MALEAARKSLGEIKKHHARDARLRIAYIDGRVKELPSIVRKAIENNVLAKDVFGTFTDILGIRVVVNNRSDVRILIKELDVHPQFNIKSRESKTGIYKAVHLSATYNWVDGTVQRRVPCEIQIRTVLQDAWAILTHRDVYRNQKALPKLAQTIADHMSRAFGTLDHLADKFRKQVASAVQPPNDLSDDAPLNRQGIAFLYYEVFGQKPDDYESKYLASRVSGQGVETVGEARRGLTRKVFGRLEQIHKTRFEMEVSPSELFEYGVAFAAIGSSAFKEYGRKIEEDWLEIDAHARSEILSELPETLSEFVKLAESREVPWEAMRELGAIQTCAICSNEIVDPYGAVEALLRHYEVEDAEEDLLDFFAEPEGIDAPEPESVNSAGLCSWCDHMMAKAD